MTVKLARKKPVVVEVIQFNMFNPRSYRLCKEFVGDTWVRIVDMPNDLPGIETLEGTMEISDGDYIIKGVNGEFYSCKEDIFEKTYDLVETYTLVEETPKRYVFNPTPEDMDKANELGYKINAEVVRLALIRPNRKYTFTFLDKFTT